jgi:predicted Zn-dependent peptidase
MHLIREEVDRVKKELVTTEELRDAKQNQIGSVLMELESTDGIARTSHNLTHFNLGLDYFIKRRKMYEKLGKDELLATAQKYLANTRLSTVIVGPKSH